VGLALRESLVADDLEKNNPLYAFVVTRLGRDTAEKGLKEVRIRQRLAIDIHPRIADQVRPQHLMGQYELAAFAALRTEEVRVRAN
jgi:hypothetical protein